MSTLASILTLAQQSSGDNDAAAAAAIAGAGVAAMFLLIIEIALIIVVIVGMWKVFEKAGKPGWGSIVPFYNQWLMCEIAGKPGWWMLLFFIPCVGIVFAIIVLAGVAKNFGKGTGFLLGMIFLPFIFYPILGFGDSQYQGPRQITGA